MGNPLSNGPRYIMFSIWVGGRPPENERRCMTQNNAAHGLTLIAEKNWIGARKFVPIAPVLKACVDDQNCAGLLALWDDPRNVSDVLRLWWLREHPGDVYVDSDCLMLKPTQTLSTVGVPSCHAVLEAVTKSNGVLLDTDIIKNASGHFVEVYIIAGAGEASFFDKWIITWANKYSNPGGIAETICYEPFEISIIRSDYYLHMSKHHKKFSLP